MIRTICCGALAVLALIGQVMQSVSSIPPRPATQEPAAVSVPVAASDERLAGLTDQKFAVALLCAGLAPPEPFQHQQASPPTLGGRITEIGQITALE